jgi:hypothetical protein
MNEQEIHAIKTIRRAMPEYLKLTVSKLGEVSYRSPDFEDNTQIIRRSGMQKINQMRSQIKSMKPWFVLWLQILAIPATHPTGRLRTQDEINACLKHGVL